MLTPIIIAVIVGLIAPGILKWFWRGATILGAVLVFGFLYFAVTSGFALYALENIK